MKSAHDANRYADRKESQSYERKSHDWGNKLGWQAFVEYGIRDNTLARNLKLSLEEEMALRSIRIGVFYETVRDDAVFFIAYSIILS